LGGPPGARRATHADRPDQCGSHVTQTGCVQLPCLAPDSPTRGHCVNGRAYLRLQTAGWVRTTTVAVGTRNTSCVLARYKKAVPFDCPKYMRQRPASGLRSAAIWLLVQLTVASSAPHVVIRKPKLIARRRPSARLPPRRPPLFRAAPVRPARASQYSQLAYSGRRPFMSSNSSTMRSQNQAFAHCTITRPVTTSSRRNSTSP